MKATAKSDLNKQSEIFTYLAIPIEAFQQSTEPGGQSLTVAQNIILKALPDGNISQQIQPITTQENIYFHVNSAQVINKEGKVTDELEIPTRPTVIEQSGKVLSLRNEEMKKTSNFNVVAGDKPGVRYINTKCRLTNSRNSRTASLKCSLCNEVLTKMVAYRKHMEMHRNMKKYKCNQCTASYNIEENLKLHMAMHNKGDLTCPICTDRKFQRVASLKAHLSLHEVDETFTCMECYREYDNEDDLNKHMESHKTIERKNANVKLPLVCTFCGLTFNDALRYKEHISCHIKTKRLVMNGKKRRRLTTDRNFAYKCEECQKTFPKYCLLERHVRIHSGEKPFACHLCERAFNQKGTLQIHLAGHSGIKPFHCLLCPAKFSQKGNLRVHVQKTHEAPGPGEKMYKCTMCTCVFKRVSSLNAHISRGHATERPCDDVSEIMNQLKQLKQLENQMLPDNVKQDLQLNTEVLKEAITTKSAANVNYVKLVDSSIEGTIRRYIVKQKKVDDVLWYICSFCGKEFKKPSDLIRHIRVHTREKPFKCKQCDQAFSLKSTLAAHVNTHIGKRQYECVLCTKMFTSARALNEHFRRHEKRSLQYMCSTCNMQFSTIAKAKIHMEIHKIDPIEKSKDIEVIMQQPMVETPNGLLPVAAPNSQVYSNEGTPSKPRPHKCHSCGAAFTKAVHLKRHVLIHTGERKFKCDICSKSFYSSYALKEHVKFHSGERNFICKICGKRFVTNAILKRHLPIHSSARPYICPYCKKRFKTVLLCRKHINVHKRDFNARIHALNEMGELENIDTDTAPTVGLHDSLTDTTPFCTDLPDNLNLSLENLPNISENTNDLTKIDNNKILQQIKDNNVISKILYTDENGIVITTDLDNNPQLQNVDNVLQTVLTQQLCQITNNLQGYVDKSTNLGLLAENPTGDVEDAIGTLTQENLADDVGCPTFYINCDNVQAITSANLYNACLAQLKNNDPLLVSEENEIHDSLSTTDPSFNQIGDLQLDYSQGFEMLMPFTLNTNLALNNLSTNAFNNSFPNIVIQDTTNELIQPQIEPGSKSVGLELVHNDALEDDPNKTNEQNQATNLIYDIFEGDTNKSTSAILEIQDLSGDKQKNIDFACSYCKQTVKSLDELKNHNCIARVPNKKKTAKKKGTKQLSANKLNNCNIKSPEIVPNLISIAVDDNVNKYNCTQCDKTFVTKTALARHMVLHEGKTAAKNACTYCGKVFKKRADLVRHLRTHTGEKPFGCDNCGKSFSLKSTLESHIRTHNTDNKEFCCVVCSSNFSSKSSLGVHMLLHTGVKPYQCTMCPEKFRTSGHRKSHMAMHLNKNAKKKTQSKNAKVQNLLASIVMDVQNTQEDELLNEVQQSVEHSEEIMQETDKDSVYLNPTLQVDPLFLHLQLHNVLLQDNNTSFVHLDVNDGQMKSFLSTVGTSDANFDAPLYESVSIKDRSEGFITPKRITSRNRNFECDICHKTYSSESVLTRHKKIHNVNCMFKCTKCETRLASQEDLENHSKLHSGYRPFCCQLCANTFSQQKNLKAHMRRIHNIVVQNSK